MSNYTVTTDFGAKDSLPSGNAAKIIKGSEFSTEFNNLATVSAEKANLASPTFTGVVTIPTATITTANTATANITTANVSGNVDLPTDGQILLGDNDDFKIRRASTNSYIEGGGSSLRLLSSSFVVKNPADDEIMIKATPDAGVDLYYNNGLKLETVSTGAKVAGEFIASAKVGIGIDAPQRPLHIYSAATDVVARLESGDATAGLELIDETSTAQFKVNAGLLTIATDTGGSVADSNISLNVDTVEKINISDVLTVFKQPTRVNDDQGLSFGNALDMTVSHVTGTNVNTIQNNNNRALLFNGVSFIFQNQNANQKLVEMTANGAVDLYHNNNKKLGTTGTGIEVTGDVDMPDNSKVLIGDDDNLQLYYDGTASLIEDTNSGNLLIRGVQLKLQSYATGNEDYITCTNNGPVALFNNGVQKANTFGWGWQVAGRIEVDTPSSNTDETAIFKKDGTNCGGIRTLISGGATGLALGSGGCGLKYTPVFSSGTASIAPFSITSSQFVNGSIDLGLSNAQWDDIYSVNAVTTSSDRNVKQSIEELTEAETRVAQACKGLVRKFKWNSAVESKGSEARYHFGVMAQDIQSAFEAEGLDAGDYGLFVSNTEEDENGVEQTRLGVRYTELLAFIIGGL
jgi:hypothetical protein